MSNITKKVLLSIGLSIPSAAIGVILREAFQAWGIFDPFSQWLGGWLKMHITLAQVEWTIAAGIALLGYAGLLWIIWRYHRAPTPIIIGDQANFHGDVGDRIGSVKHESSPQRIGSPLQIEFEKDERYERAEQILEAGIFRRLIYVSVFSESMDDISDCNVRLIAATPRPKTGDNPTTFPVPFGANFDLRGKQRKFIQIVRFAENHGKCSILEHDHIIISAAVGGLFPGFTTIPIPSKNNPAILTLEAFAPGIASRMTHLRIWVIEWRIHAKIT
jgi:hypothetical protein